MDAMNKVEIIYEDNHILVAVKPYNMLSQADATREPDILSYLKQYIKSKYIKPGNVYLGLVQRLDRPAGGLMIFARTSKAASRLSDAIRKGEIKKKYLIRTESTPDEASGMLEDYLIKESGNNVRIAKKDEPGAKYAALKYRVLESGSCGALIEVELLTGRPHQIRVQFASRGIPLLGDARYGSSGRQLALWAYGLEFVHPVKNETMKFEYMPSEQFFK